MSDDDTGTQGSHSYSQPATQQERLHQLREDQRARNASAGDDEGRRPYGQSKPTPLDAMPWVAPAWSAELGLQPKEAELGVNVNWLPDCSGVGGRDPREWPSEYDPPTSAASRDQGSRNEGADTANGEANVNAGSPREAELATIISTALRRI